MIASRARRGKGRAPIAGSDYNDRMTAIVRRAAVLTGALLLVALALHGTTSAQERAVVIPPPALDAPKIAGPTQTAIVAGGCFWGVQGVYQHVKGVQRARSGYAGGDKATANYDAVSDGKTRHAEAVEIRFDPKEISYGEILQIYFSVAHDPTQLDRQGPDVGPQYRSNIFYADDAQQRIAEAYIAQLTKAKAFGGAIATRVDKLPEFYAAESYHQDFLQKHPTHPYIVIHDLPKIEQLKQVFPTRYREKPVTTDGAK